MSDTGINKLPPRAVLLAVLSIAVGAALVFLFSKAFFYAEPGYIYHVRTVFGSEEVVTEVGYKFYPMGRYNAWKRAMTVQALGDGNVSGIRAEADSENTSASLPPMSIMFLDQVDAHAEATVRFSIPSDTESFLRLAHEYRTPENLLRTALMPAFKETLQANASLMAAEEYYAGGRTEFNSEFENQMGRGIYLVKRNEVTVRSGRAATSSANASLGTEQEEYGEDSKTVFIVQKVLDDTGQPKRKSQRFLDFGITVVSALVTDMRPNQKFIERMQLKQKASADRAIAREQRVQEEEQRLLAIARGEREVAERQAKAKVEQIQKTTEAETDKQLAITGAEKLKAQASIARETAEINLGKAKFEAETRRTLAEAEAYQKKVVMQADNALAQKLDAEIEIQKLWASAFAKRQVPSTVFGGGAGGGAPVGSDSEVRAFMQLLTLDAAKRLSYDRDVSKAN
ncbi:SPFH domain-containing protein [Teredinibacter waterburyi]|uniref:SPFH domain-containing protein n=1 Tax=Teredinibacter waterburyi TaxID=1500538 RepID=UPI00165F9438|nr:SPFH domain-containing protein [Teredinibacter waterburyi]